MKSSNIFRTLVLVIIFSLLVLAIPATPVQAAIGAITIYPLNGPVGTTVSISGSGFTASGYYTVMFSSTAVAYGSCDGSGNFSTTFAVPEYYHGAFPVSVTTPSDTSNTLNFTVTPAITHSPTSGYVGSIVTISGTGFAVNSAVSFYLDNVSVSASTTTTNTNGSFTGTTLTIPARSRGSHTIKAQDASSNYNTATFTVRQKITVTPTSGAVGDQVSITGSGFYANSPVSFYWDNVGVSTTTTTTDTNGSFTGTTFTIPSSSRGSHTIKAQDASSNYYTATFTIGEKVTITPLTGSSGTTVTVTGTGFRANQTITIKYNGTGASTSPPSVSTNAEGTFTASFNVPAGLAGTYLVEASDGIYTDSASFTATADATISQTTTEAAPGYVGMSLTITGTGFMPNATVTVSYASDSVALATVTTDGNGAFSVTVTIPSSTGGNHTITVTDGHTTKQFSFVMESQAPLTPEPLLPAEATKSKAEAFFDWGDVDSDPSGVTYSLQVGADANFTNIILEKTGLTDSEYLVTEEEKLESVGKDEPYYWRARAVDGASNASAWTTPIPFRVGFVFSLPSWGIYVLLGIVALFLGVLGFWLGRRTAYY